MTDHFKLDLGKLAQGSEQSINFITTREEEPANERTSLAIAAANRRPTLVRNPEMAWMEATSGLQGNLIRALQEYKTSRRDRQALAPHRQRMIDEVTTQYVDYLREEARLASEAALKARDAVLRQELTKLRAHLFTQLADITGNAVTEIESIFQAHAAKISSPVLQEAYARFIMSKIFDLLDQSQK